MQMVFHGSSSNLSALIAQPGMQQVLGEDINRILVTPEGRSAEGWGSDISERDLLDVMADVQRTYKVDCNERATSPFVAQRTGYVPVCCSIAL